MSDNLDTRSFMSTIKVEAAALGIKVKMKKENELLLQQNSWGTCVNLINWKSDCFVY